MAEYKYESEIKQVPYSQSRVYDRLADLNHIADYTHLLDQLPQDKVKIENLHYDRDSLGFSIAPIGNVEMRVVERDDPKLIKLEATTAPIPRTVWIQILPTAPDASKMKLTLRTELNIFMKGMVQKPLREGIDQVATILASLEY